MSILVIALVLAALVALDVKGKVDLSHPVWVFLTAAGYFAAVVYTAFLFLLALAETLTDHANIGSWLAAAVSILPGTLFGLYVLFRANLFPMGRRSATLRRKTRRILDCGLILGIPIQTIVVGGYLFVAVVMQQAFDGPLWLAPFYPLVLAVLWPMAHLVFHVALVAWMLDPILILVGMLVGIFWTAQVIFLVHGTVRGCLLQKRSVGGLVGRVLLALVPVVDLILAVQLRFQLKREPSGEAVL